MFPASSLCIGIFGPDELPSASPSRGCALWPVGYAAAVAEAGATPFAVGVPPPGFRWDEPFESLDGLLLVGRTSGDAHWASHAASACHWCRQRRIPLLAVDGGLHVLNTALGGTLHPDLRRDLPQALQHQHSPEPGDRHAITVAPGTRLAQLYGEGEIVVNSEHRSAVSQVARGFRVSAHALDGVIEAIEAEADGWFALGVQWRPASASASGLDIQLFRGLIEACQQRQRRARPAACLQAA